MARDLSAYLQDILDACSAIEDFMRGVSLEEYRNTRSIRSAVEREFIIIGEALRRISALDERLFSSISNSRAIVDFRNLLAHDYGAVDDDAVFGLVYSDLIVLKAEVGELLLEFLAQTHPAIHLSRRHEALFIPFSLCGQVMASFAVPDTGENRSRIPIHTPRLSAMSALLKNIQEQARALSAEERAMLPESMLESLHKPINDIEVTWAEEIEDRVRAFDRGEIPSYSAEEVFAEAYRNLQ